MNTVGERIAAWRADAGVTQASMSMQLGIHIGQLKKYEQDRTVPGGEALAAFAKAGVNLNWLLTGEGEMHAGVGAAPSQVQQQTLQAAPALNHELLQAAVEGVAEGLRRINRTVPADKHAQLIAAAYELLLDGQGNVGKNNVINFIRAAA